MGLDNEQDRSRPRRGRRAKTKGTNLYPDPRNGHYIWRRTHKLTGKRLVRSTETPNFEIALAEARKFEEEHQRECAGLKVYDVWKKPLAPLLDGWIATHESQDKNRRKLAMQVRRALELLKLTTAADLCDLPRLERNIKALERQGDSKEGYASTFLRRCVQEPLRLFSGWLAENHRHLDRDPLADWKLLDIPDAERRKRRAPLPEEIARAFLAMERLDELYGREQPLAPVVLALLIGAPRAGAFIERDVKHLDRAGSRIDLGPGVGKKLRGDCGLDARTLREIEEYLGERRSGPLFLSPTGTRLNEENLLDAWREAFGLGVVDELWPAGEPRDFETEWLVARCLARGKAKVGAGGNPRRLRPETVRARSEREEEIERIASRLRDGWAEKMRGVDLHSFRMTHETWARVKGVNPIFIDKQLGHSSAGGEAVLKAAQSLLESPTGRRYYLDMSITIIDARKSAEAVRELLDEAAVAIRETRATGLMTGYGLAYRPEGGTSAAG